MKAKKVRGSPGNHAILPRKWESMGDKREPLRNKWKKDNTILLSLRLSKQKDKAIIQALEEHRPLVSYIRELVKNDTDTDKAWAICMGVRIGAEYARTFKWVKLGEELAELANELGQKLGLAPDEVRRQAHQVMERERL